MSVYVATSAEARMDAKMQRFRDAVAAQSLRPGRFRVVPDAGGDTVVALVPRRHRAFRAPAALDDVQRDRHALSDAWQAREC